MRRTLQNHVGLTCLAIALSWLIHGATVAAGQETDSAKAPKAPKTHTVKREVFKIEVKLDGTFEARDMTPVVLRPESWSDFTVIEAVEQGQRVKKGETLVKLDMTKIDQAIADIEVGQELAYLTLQQAKEEVSALEKSVPLDLQEAERSQTVAREDLQRFLEHGRALSEEAAHQSMKQMRNYLGNQLEELNQLEKMYNADDLTEETEEIILKRQRDAVESARFSVKRAESRTEETLEFNLPRQEKSLQTAAMRTSLALEKAEATLPGTLRSKQLGLIKSRYQQKLSDEKLEKLRSDRQRMDITATADGVVYYGNCVNGKWTTTAAAAKLREGGKLAPHNIFMTLVQPRPLFIRTNVAEKDLHNVRGRMEGTAVANADPDMKMTVIVEVISPIPTSGTDFDTKLAVDLPPDSDMLMPGMTCQVTLTVYLNEDAITVPASALFSDDKEEEKQYVLVELEDGEHEKRSVEIGRKTDKVAEVLDGLEEGEKILTSKPTDSDQ